MGTTSTSPIKGISLLLGNYLAGGKVVADAKVLIEDVISGIFSSCAVSRAMTEKAQEEPKDCEQYTDVSVDLTDTFLNNYDK